jgi:putative heme-binding domain-containing protein
MSDKYLIQVSTQRLQAFVARASACRVETRLDAWPVDRAVVPRILAVLICALSLSAQNSNPHTTASDIAQGKRIFQGHCAGCHGPGGEGGRGAILARPTLTRATDDATLFQILKDGIKGTEMPPAPELNEHEKWQVAAFVKSLGRVDVSKSIPGDPAKGEQLFASNGCSKCHTVKMKGGRMGPDLTQIGSRRNAAYLREALIAPEATLPEGFMEVRVTTKTGEYFTGIILNEDTYSVQIRDLADRLHSFWKSELSEFRKERDKSPMPSYRNKLSPADLDDLVSYLASLRGES